MSNLTRILCLVLVGSIVHLGLLITDTRASNPRPDSSRVVVVHATSDDLSELPSDLRPEARTLPKPSSEFFGELEALDDPELAQQTAGDLTGGELLVSLIFIILFLPLGLILLIIFAVDDDDEIDF